MGLKGSPFSPQVASYEFTTLTCVPGVFNYKGAKIQLLDLPGIIEGAKDGKGRGKQVISVAYSCSLILIARGPTSIAVALAFFRMAQPEHLRS